MGFLECLSRPRCRGFLLFLCASLFACSSAKSGDRSADPTQPETLVLRHQAAVGSVSFPELAADLGYLAPLKLEFVGNTISGPQDIQTVVTGDVDFGLAFHGAIIKLIAAGAPIRAVVGGYGVDEQTFSGCQQQQNGLLLPAATPGLESELNLGEELVRGT
jgi:ABC-type nitrate/sulfonate/bicarbonate transport system substrate-binding protein